MIVFAWMALVLPGLVFVVSRCRHALEGGVLPVLGLAWLCSFAALFLLAVPCFLLGLSVGAYAVLVGLLMAWAIVEVVRKRLHRGLKGIARDLVGVELLVVVAAVWGFARIGARQGGDALVHVTRIRQLLDSGMVNEDPWVGGGHFFSLYHTNLIHTLHALVARVTGLHFLEVWRSSLALAVLLSLCGGAYLAWSVHRSRWAAWAGGLAGTVAVAAGAVTFLGLPNKIAPLYCIPMALGLAIGALRTGPTRTATGLLAAAVLVTSASHALYGVFLVVLLGPLLAFRAMRAWRSGTLATRPALLLAATLLLALPMPLVSQLTKSDWSPSRVESQAREGGEKKTRRQRRRRPVSPPTTKDAADRFIATDAGYLVDPLRGFGGTGGWRKLRFRGLRYVLLAAALGLGLIGRSRRECLALAAIVASGAAVLYIPPLPETFASLSGARWTLLRFSTAFFPLSLTAALAGAAAMLEVRLKRAWLRPLATALVLALTLFAWGKPQMKKWRANADLARDGSIRLPTGAVKTMRTHRAAMDEHVPAGARVLIDARAGMELVRLDDVRILAPRRASLGVGNLKRLRRLNHKLIHDEKMPWARRRELLRELDVRFFVPLKYPKWARGHVKNDIRDPRLGEGFVLLELDLD